MPTGTSPHTCSASTRLMVPGSLFLIIKEEKLNAVLAESPELLLCCGILSDWVF